ncbi:MAG: nicotinate-nucleotide adenylyltransferase [Pseudomonadota bacterium]
MVKKQFSPILTPPHLQDVNRWCGLRIGLFGGSFNPPHAGHLHIAKLAQIQFGLDFVWWLITPQNPLKKNTGGYEQRFSAVENMIADHPRQMATHLERDLATEYSYETVLGLKNTYQKTDFLWICGMDNAHIFHQWDQWQAFLDIMPITFIARPPAQYLVKNCPIKQIKIPQYGCAFGQKTDLKTPGIYWLNGSKMLNISSSKIRNN